MNKKLQRAAISTLVVVAGTFVVPGYAQNAEKSGEEVPGGQLEEIVVTATKRAERLQDVPISMSAFSASDVTENTIVAIPDFANRVPGVTYIPNGGNEAYFSIRGIQTLDDSSGTDQPVLLFTDGVAATGVADMQPDLYDIERIEVLKGPQGTLFGRNATGGVVSIFTNDPAFTTEANGEVTYGNYNLIEAKGILNLPVDDTQAVRLVVTTHNRDAYVKDFTTNDYIGAENRYTARGKWLVAPSESFRLVVGFDYLHENNSQTTWVSGNFQPSLFPALSYSPTSTYQSFHPRSDRQIWGVHGQFDWNTPLGTVTSITGYRDVFASSSATLVADPTNEVLSFITSRDSQWSEELRLASPKDQRLTWIAGIYYVDVHKTRPITADFNIVPNTVLSLIAAEQQFSAYINQATTTTSPAAFVDVTYNLTNKVQLSVGGRYTSESKSGYSAIDPATLLSGPPISAKYSNSWSAFTPRFALTYKPTESLMTYAAASKGFQSGGYNVQGSTEAGLQTPFNPEYVWNYEIGEKFEGLNRRVLANVSAFVADYSDLQIVQYDGRTGLFLTTNAGSAQVKGVEADFSAIPVTWLTLGANLAFLHARFTDYVINNGPGLPPTINTGNQIPYTPERSATFSGEVHTTLNRGVSLAAGGDLSYRSAMMFDSANDTPQYVQDASKWEGILNLHARISGASDRWWVMLWGKNVTDKRFTTNGSDLTPYVATLGEFSVPTNHFFLFVPNSVRTFGVTIAVTL